MELLDKNPSSVNWAYFWDHHTRAAAIAHHLMSHPSAKVEGLKRELSETQSHLQETLDVNGNLSAERDALKEKLAQMEAEVAALTDSKRKVVKLLKSRGEEMAKLQAKVVGANEGRAAAERAREAAERSRADFKEYPSDKILSSYSEVFEHAVREATFLFPGVVASAFDIDKDVIDGRFVSLDEDQEDTQAAEPTTQGDGEGTEVTHGEENEEEVDPDN